MHWRASLLFTIFGIGQGVGAIPVERVFDRDNMVSGIKYDRDWNLKF